MHRACSATCAMQRATCRIQWATYDVARRCVGVRHRPSVFRVVADYSGGSVPYHSAAGRTDECCAKPYYSTPSIAYRLTCKAYPVTLGAALYYSARANRHERTSERLATETHRCVSAQETADGARRITSHDISISNTSHFSSIYHQADRFTGVVTHEAKGRKRCNGRRKGGGVATGSERAAALQRAVKGRQRTPGYSRGTM